MKTSSPFVKVLLVSVVIAVLGYIGLDVPRDSVEEVVNTGLESLQSTKAPVESTAYAVEQVIDGDTFKVGVRGVSESVRVVGIDTPETKYSSRGAECFGEEASEHAKALLEGASVQLTLDETQDSRDKYNRILAYVSLPDGRDFGQVMIADGYAYEYTYQGSIYKKQQLYKNAQARAQEERVGLWEDGVCGE